MAAPTTTCTFTDPVTPDLGQDHPASYDIDGEAPVVPTLFAATYDPDATPPFVVIL